MPQSQMENATHVNQARPKMRRTTLDAFGKLINEGKAFAQAGEAAATGIQDKDWMTRCSSLFIFGKLVEEGTAFEGATQAATAGSEDSSTSVRSSAFILFTKLVENGQAFNEAARAAFAGSQDSEKEIRSAAKDLLAKLLKRGFSVEQLAQATNGQLSDQIVVEALGRNVFPLVGAGRLDPNILDKVLALGANMNAMGPRKQTALMLACRAGNTNAVRLLLERGADIHQRSKFQNIDVEDEVECAGDLDAWRFDDMNEPGSDSVLMLACRFGNVEMVCCLLENGAHLDAHNKRRETALMIARRRGDVETVLALRKYGAEPSGKPSTNKPGKKTKAEQSRWYLLRDKVEDRSYHNQDFARSIVGQILAHDEFKNHEALTSLAKTLLVLDMHLNIDNHNYEDLTDSAIVEIGHDAKQRVEYFGESNANCAIWDARMTWHLAGEQRTLLDSNADVSEEMLRSLQPLKPFVEFAKVVGLGHLPLKLVLRYFTFILSSMARENVFNYEPDEYQLLAFALGNVWLSEAQLRQLDNTPLEELQTA